MSEDRRPDEEEIAGDESPQETARKNPLQASKGLSERVGDKLSAGGEKAKGGKDYLTNRLNSSIDEAAESGNTVAKGVKNTQKAIELGARVADTAKNIGIATGKLVATLGNPWVWGSILAILVVTMLILGTMTFVQVYGKNNAIESCTKEGTVVADVNISDESSIEEKRNGMMAWFMSNNFSINGNKPLSKEQAAAIAGNFQAESNFGFKTTEGQTMNGASNEEVDAWTKGGPRGLGLAQWTNNPGRASELIELARSMGKNWYDPVVQFTMIANELNNGSYGPDLAAAGFFGTSKSAGELAIIFHDIYEISADSPAMKQRRSDAADEAAASYKGGSGYDPSGGDNCKQETVSSGEWVHPLGDKGPMDWTTYNGGGHEFGDIDFHFNQLEDPIYAVADGVVTSPGDGNCNPLVIQHPDAGVSSIYQHMNSVDVKTGDKVTAGQKIGGAGTKGCGSSGVHLHFGIWTTGVWGSGVPSVKFMRERGVELGNCISGDCTLATG